MPEPSNAYTYLLVIERMIHAESLLSQEERSALNAWEREYLRGDGNWVTSDWPGWADVFRRIQH